MPKAMYVILFGSLFSPDTAMEVLNETLPSFSKTKFPEDMFGIWDPKGKVPIWGSTGPTSHIFEDSYQHGLTALRDHRTGDVWWTLLMGQEFHMRGNQVQYCFGEVGLVGEQAPFEVHSMTNTELILCWRSGLRGFPTYAKDCSGCDCGKSR